MEQTLAAVDGIKARAPEMKPLEPNPSPSNPGPRDEPPWWSPKDLDAEAKDSPRDYGTKEY